MKKIISFIVAIILSVAVASFGVYKVISEYKSKQSEKSVGEAKQETPVHENNNSTQQHENNNFTQQNINDKNELNVSGTVYNLASEEKVYELMHCMANTKIVADAIWGTVDITSDRVDALITAVNKSNWNDKSNLLDILNRWKNKDFSKGVEDHNYIWSKLGGTLGKATNLKK